MASIVSSCRFSARIVARQLRQHGSTRSFRTTSAGFAAHNFAMPALSPTMTEGNISKWKVNEGDSFSAGDVLLEVETDKAQMDVEAQDDGVMAKIIQPDGSKSVKVGSRIAVLAEPGDDISSLEIPPEDSAPAPSPPKQESQPSPEPPAASPPKADAVKPPSASKPQPPQKYPLYPSVEVLIHQHHLSADQIPATGPQGRLLKGDVLAYLQQIPSSYPSELQSRMTKLSHLDLSNVKPAAPPPAKPSPSTAAATQEKELPPPPVDIATHIDLTAVLKVQKKMQDSLGITLPLSTFIARAIDLANENLPPRSGPPTADELFHHVIGAHKVPKKTRGGFMPQIVALPQNDMGLGMMGPAPVGNRGSRDLFDEIVGAKKGRSAQGVRRVGIEGAVGGAENIFRVSVEKDDAKRARVFLERVKSVLESDPGRLVL